MSTNQVLKEHLATYENAETELASIIGDLKTELEYGEIIEINDGQWITISRNPKLPEGFIRKYSDKLDWGIMSIHQKLPLDLMVAFREKLSWRNICKHQEMTVEFGEQLKKNEQFKRNGIQWSVVSMRNDLSDGFMLKFQDKLNWHLLSRTKGALTETNIRKFKDKVQWMFVEEYQVLSEDFIREHKDYLYWPYISRFQVLSEDFIEEFKDKMDWNFTVENQKLSIEFVERFSSRINWRFLSDYGQSREFKRRFAHRMKW